VERTVHITLRDFRAYTIKVTRYAAQSVLTVEMGGGCAVCHG